MSNEYTKIGISGAGDDQKVHLKWNEATDAGGRQSLDLECKDIPLQSFAVAMAALNRFVAHLFDFSKDYADGCHVHIVSLSTTGNRMGVIVSVKKTLSSGLSFNFNSPRYVEADEETPQVSDMPEGMPAAIRVLAEEAEKYRGGQRSQISMFSKGNGEAADEAEEAEESDA